MTPLGARLVSDVLRCPSSKLPCNILNPAQQWPPRSRYPSCHCSLPLASLRRQACVFARKSVDCVWHRRPRDWHQPRLDNEARQLLSALHPSMVFEYRRDRKARSSAVDLLGRPLRAAFSLALQSKSTTRRTFSEALAATRRRFRAEASRGNNVVSAVMLANVFSPLTLWPRPSHPSA